MGKSTIEWTDATWNCVRGCSIVSKGCTNCYAMKQAHRFSGAGQAYEGLTQLTRGGPVWTGKVRLVPELVDWPRRHRKPMRIFVNSMGDLFHEDVPDEFIERVWWTMEGAKQHIYQVLTKRPERMRAFAQRWADDHMGPTPGVWLGVSVEDQVTADERIPLLLRTPAAVRFISAEPLLGQIDLRAVSTAGIGAAAGNKLSDCLHWVIAGGESGPHARPPHPDWFRLLKAQCQAAGVAFFMKQITERGRKVPIEQWPVDLQLREFPDAA